MSEIITQDAAAYALNRLAEVEAELRQLKVDYNYAKINAAANFKNVEYWQDRCLGAEKREREHKERADGFEVSTEKYKALYLDAKDALAELTLEL